MSTRGYDKPAGRSGGGRRVVGKKVKSADEIWTDDQRRLYREIKDLETQIENLLRERDALTDQIGIRVRRLLSEAGMSKTRLRTVFGYQYHRIDDLVERANTALAIQRELEDGG